MQTTHTDCVLGAASRSPPAIRHIRCSTSWGHLVQVSSLTNDTSYRAMCRPPLQLPNGNDFFVCFSAHLPQWATLIYATFTFHTPFPQWGIFQPVEGGGTFLTLSTCFGSISHTHTFSFASDRSSALHYTFFYKLCSIFPTTFPRTVAASQLPSLRRVTPFFGRCFMFSRPQSSTHFSSIHGDVACLRRKHPSVGGKKQYTTLNADNAIEHR